MKPLGSYKNGNYTVTIFEDGTKIRHTEDDEFNAVFPENFDCKICNRCDMNCPQCHEKSTCDGKLGNLNREFIKHLREYTEISIGGGNPLEQPDLVDFLKELRERKVIANITVNQVHFMKYKNFLKSLTDGGLIHGLGISLVNPTIEFIEVVKEFPNAVIHVINGMFTALDYIELRNNNLKILILGYKNFGRGVDYHKIAEQQISKNMNWLSKCLPTMLKEFNVVSFDNLAIKQLNVQSMLSQEDWEKFYMGDDGQHTMYIDLVEGVFAKNSTATKRYPLMNTIEEMFAVIKNED